MIKIEIPGSGIRHIKHAVFDFNGTIACDGILIRGVKTQMKKFSDVVEFHVITADTFGSAEQQLKDAGCNLVIIPGKNQARAKAEFLDSLGPDQTLCAGNGANDVMMLEKAGTGIAVLQEEGLACSCLGVADLVVKSVLDIFCFFKTPERLIASLRN